VTLALAVRLSLALCAVLAAVVARRSSAHRPLAVTLCALVAVDALRWAMRAPLLASPDPRTGWWRALFHVEQAAVVGWRFAIAACLWATFAAVAGRRSRAPVALGAVWLTIAAALAVSYPTVRGTLLLAAGSASQLTGPWIVRDPVAAWPLAQTLSGLTYAMVGIALLVQWILAWRARLPR
jgi:hypothetical protein